MSKSKTRSAAKRIFAPDGFRPVAILTVSGAPAMTERARKDIAKWLCKQADAIQVDGANYARRFRARYLVAK